MTADKDSDSRARLWVALGNEPGVSAWFSVWSLSRNWLGSKNPAPPKKSCAVAECNPKQVNGSPA
jgi:hypothetical protein